MSALQIISANERVNETKGIKGCIFGKSGIGKTSLLWTLDPKKTLFIDLEAGDLSVDGWQGDTMRPRTWRDCRHLSAFIGGANPALDNSQTYSQAHYDKVCKELGGAESLDKYDTIFIDSITVAGRWCFDWCKKQPQAFSEKSGKPDIRGAYGLHGQEMIKWLVQFQQARDRNVWFVGILDEKVDGFNERFFTPQIEGNKTGLELPGIVDEVITMTDVMGSDKKQHRVFVCQAVNQYGYPAKDRSTRLDVFEKPHLGDLMKKIQSKGKPANQRLVYPSLADGDNDSKSTKGA